MKDMNKAESENQTYFQKNEVHLKDYWRILSKRRGVALTVFFLVMIVAVVYLLSATPVYKGTAQLLFDIEQNQTLDFVEGGAIIHRRDPTEYFNTQRGIIASRAFADRVVRKMQLDKNPYFLELKERKENTLAARINERILSAFPQEENPQVASPFAGFPLQSELDPYLTDMVLNHVELETSRMNNLMKINYTSDNPAVAAMMANGIAAAFIEHNLNIRVRPFRDAAEWLQAQLVESKESVAKTERTLQQYREGKGIVSFEARESVITQQLEQLITQHVQTEAKAREAEIRYKQIERVIDSPERLATVPDIMNNLVIQGLRNEELAVKTQISELSERFGPKHPRVIKANTQLDTIQMSIISEARKMLSAAKTEFEIAKSRETSLRRSIEAQKQEVLNLTRKAINFNVLAGEATSNKQFYELLLRRYQEASLSGGINISNVQIVDGATVPKAPVEPRRGMIFLLALMLGGFGGIAAAFFTDYMDDTIKTAEDVNKQLRLPFFDVVPLTDPKNGPIFMAADPKSPAAESFRTIRTGIMLSSAIKQPRVLLVTSATPNEGKSTTAANLAVAMAQMGEKVLLIDGDMRRRNLHELFQIESDVGISDMIVNPEKLSEVIIQPAAYPNLDILPGGNHAPNPSELLSSVRMKEFISFLSKHYDRIIIDSPPLLAFSDALILSTLADGIILVVWGGKTPVDIVRKGLQTFNGIDANILGVVLNKVDTTKRSYYYYPYYSYYYSDQKRSSWKTTPTRSAGARRGRRHDRSLLPHTLGGHDTAPEPPPGHAPKH